MTSTKESQRCLRTSEAWLPWKSLRFRKRDGHFRESDGYLPRNSEVDGRNRGALSSTIASMSASMKVAALPWESPHTISIEVAEVAFVALAPFFPLALTLALVPTLTLPRHDHRLRHWVSSRSKGGD